MKRVFYIIIAIVALIYIASFSTGRPDSLGLDNGRLAEPPSSPNCVSSQADSGSSHYIAPFTFEGGAAEELERLKAQISSLPRARLISSGDNYLHYEFTTLIFRFTDDLEIYIDEEAQLIHLRSASRLGHSDLGVNRRRVESLRQLRQ